MSKPVPTPRADNTLDEIEIILVRFANQHRKHLKDETVIGYARAEAIIKSKKEAKTALQAYIDTKCREARIDELRFVRDKLTSDTPTFINIQERIAELSKDQEGK